MCAVNLLKYSMNVIEYKTGSSNIAYCIVDRTADCADMYSRELVKNLSDFTISNIFVKHYSAFVSLDEDALLNHVADLGYKHAVVISTGTEFINGRRFFNYIESLTDSDYFLYGHILDRAEAYYELHHQCYLINLEKYNKLNRPSIGNQQLGSSHTQYRPNRCVKNIHDDYTPYHISSGSITKQYSHKMHGYNIISEGLRNGYCIRAFTDEGRDNKKYYYPENSNVFLEKVSYAYAKNHVCKTSFVHHESTDPINIDDTYDQIITPASSLQFYNYLNDGGNVIYYDYNQTALDYYKNKSKENTEFVNIDLLGEYDIGQLIKHPDKKTLLNLTNIFNYEGTAMFCNLKYRLCKENQLLSKIPAHWTVLNQTSYIGFGDTNNISKLRKPTWHMNTDWNN